MPTFLLEPNAYYAGQLPDLRPLLPNNFGSDDGDQITGVSPPFQKESTALLSTSPQIGGNIQNMMKNLRGGPPIAPSNKPADPAPSAGDTLADLEAIGTIMLPPSPFDTTNDLSWTEQPYLDPQEMKKFAKNMMNSLKYGVGIGLLSNAAESSDEEDNDDLDGVDPRESLSNLAFVQNPKMIEDGGDIIDVMPSLTTSPWTFVGSDLTVSDVQT